MRATTERASWQALRARAEGVLSAAPVPDPATEARWIVEEASGYDAAELIARETELAPLRAVFSVDTMVERRVAGEPIQYVLGEWSFRGLDLLVDRRVLIPRPETEITAEIAIEEARRLGARRGRPDPWAGAATTYAVVDLGTGSGAIALALAAELPDAAVWATDESDAALAVARANLAGAGTIAARVRLEPGSWFGALPGDLLGQLRLVVANPPYVAEHELAGLSPEVRNYEPVASLVSGPTGLEAIEVITATAPAWLERPGALVCEIAPHQRDPVIERARDAGFDDVEVRRDLAGRDRVLVARLG